VAVGVLEPVATVVAGGTPSSPLLPPAPTQTPLANGSEFVIVVLLLNKILEKFKNFLKIDEFIYGNKLS
jgi:hypothetical protein